MKKDSKIASTARGLESQEYMAQAAADINEVPLRTLQDWCKNGLLDWPGQGTGNRRKFNVYDLVLIGLCKSLLGRGFKTELVRKAVAFFHRENRANLRIAFGSEYAWLLLPIYDEPGVSTSPTKFFYYKHGERPSQEEAMQALDPDVDAAVTINIQRIAERVLSKIV
jgi:DNA-binding transcriptional MerR regulator